MALNLPSGLKARLRPLPQWPPIALQPPQDAVQVRLVTEHGGFDVTRTSVVASLRPLTLAVGLEPQLAAALKDGPEAKMHFADLDSSRIVGTLRLRCARSLSSAGMDIGLFEVLEGAHRCVRWPYRPWNHWLQTRRMLSHQDPNNFFMPPKAIHQQMIFYICPRPVVLVSVDDGSHSNLFPMDLIGPVSADRFTLALRSTSPSIAAMKSTRRVALSDVPARDYTTAYKLGVHHKNVKVEWDRLPFEIRRSQAFSLPCPAIALRVRELEILDFEHVGSHVLFITRIVSEQRSTDSPQFFHTSGIYQHFRTRNGRPFPAAS